MNISADRFNLRRDHSYIGMGTIRFVGQHRPGTHLEIYVSTRSFDGLRHFDRTGPPSQFRTEKKIYLPRKMVCAMHLRLLKDGLI